MKRDWSISATLALACHLGVLFGFKADLGHRAPRPKPPDQVEVMLVEAPSQAAPLAMSASASSVPSTPPREPVAKSSEQLLIREPPKSHLVEKAKETLSVLQAPAPKTSPPPEPALVKSDGLVVSKSIEAPARAEALKSAPEPSGPVSPIPESVPPAPVVGNASSPKHGLAPTTVKAQPDLLARPAYRKNPEPAYPLAARRRRQEGVVLLAVTVTAQGKAERVAVKQSSGYPALDEAAVKSVGGWQFEPARLGARSVESAIEVPIRFKLSE